MRSIIAVAFLAATAASSLYGRYDDSESRERGDEPPAGQVWALLVAGSNGWYNYRHQADVAHAFHVLKGHGVPETNIITMMFDDVVSDPSNADYKGRLFNSPAWVDVYEGLKIDYREQDVTPANFLAVLKGDRSRVQGGNGRVIESGPNDRIFVYFADHGSAGFICFPNDDQLTTKSLNDALKWMHENKRFSDLVFYLEACESGSMFERVLHSDINVYAVTAAKHGESSWSTYCYNDRGLPCLGDQFSVNWMEDSDAEDLTTETIGAQFKIVKKETNESHVCHFGKMSTENDPVSWFQGAAKAASTNSKKFSAEYKSKTAVPSREIEMRHLERHLQQTNDAGEFRTIQARIDEINEKRAHARRVVKGVVSAVCDQEEESVLEHAKRRVYYMERNEESSIVNFPECHHRVVHTFKKLCVNSGDMEYYLPHTYVLNNMCNAAAGRAHDILAAIVEHCLVKALE